MSVDESVNAFGTEELIEDPDVNIMFEVCWEVANKGRFLFSIDIKYPKI